MLQSIRDRATGPIAWGIVGLITIPFAFWGIDSYVRGPTNPEVAEVGDVEISQGQLQRAYDQQYQRLQQMMGEGFDPDSINNSQLRRGVLENIVREELLTQYVRNAGYRVTDVAVANNLRQQTVFQENGTFSPQRYREVLARNGYTPAAYEARLRNALAMDQMQQGLGASTFVTRAEVDAALRLEKQKREIQYLEFDLASHADQADIEDSAIQAFYESQPARFSTPERVKLAYIEIDKTKLKPAFRPDKAVLKAMYEAEKQSRFTTPEQRKARHILIQVTEDLSEANARSKAEELAAKLAEGADFEALAKEHSDDTGSKENGGDLGWVGRGVMVPEFEEALFSLAEGETSGPVKTSFGWHIIRADEVRELATQDFNEDSVQETLIELYREKELAERFQQLSKQLDDLSFDHPDSLEPAADELDIKIKTSDWLERNGGEGLGQFSQVMDAAFSDAVLQDKENSSLLKLSDSRVMVIRVAEHEVARQKPLKEVREIIEAQLREEAGRAKIRELASKAVELINSGQTASEVASTLGARLHTPGWVEREAENLDGQLLGHVFSMRKPEAGKNRVSIASTSDGNQAAVILLGVEDGKPAEVSDEERMEVERRLAARTANLEFRVFENAIREDIDVEIHEDRLK